MLSDFFNSIFRFRKTNLSLLLIATYVLIGLLFAYDHNGYKHVLPGPSDFDEAPQTLEKAWLDLQIITESFHPYFTLDNVRVHDYLLERILNVTDPWDYAKVYDDVQNRTSICLKTGDVFDPSSKTDKAYYFESANILTKIEGKDPKLPALLLSAHYDSVSTSHGATDDGKGIVTLLAILEHFTKNQPERTIVFNFNDNEEFGLLGAEAFFSHPWSKLVRYFINLEGTGTGSKAVLFRTSDTSTSKIYQRAVKKYPFGNSIYQQGFNDGLVKSQTDYVIYSKYGLRGFDIAFYKPRALYHTVSDSTQHTSREALWHMMHTAWQLTDYISRKKHIDDEDSSPAVFFDILGLNFIALSAKTLFKWNCIILLTCPLLTAIIYLLGGRKREQGINFWSVWLRTPLSFGFSTTVVYFTQLTIVHNNPLIISRSYIIPLLTLSAEFILINYLILSFLEYISPTNDFKTIAFDNLTTFLWFFLLNSTINLYRTNYQETGTYVCTLVYLFMSLGTSIGYFFRMFRRNPEEQTAFQADQTPINYGSQNDDEEQGQASSINEAPAEVQPNTAPNEVASITDEHTESAESQMDERAPLLESNQTKKTQPIKDRLIKKVIVKSSNYDWSIQFLVVLPITTFFVFNSLDLILEGINQTIQEGRDATNFTWSVVFLGSIALSIPLIPFACKLNYVLGLIFSSVFFVGFLLSLVEVPFTPQAPLKVRFSQDIHLSRASEAIMRVQGRKGEYISTMLEDLPSVKENNVSISCQDITNGMERCSYVGLYPNLIDSDSVATPSTLLSINVLTNDRLSPDRSSYAPINARLKLQVKENRACSLWFNSSSHKSSPVRQVSIHKTLNGRKNSTETKTIKIGTGINELHLYKLDFEEQYYDISIQWLPKIVTTEDGPDLHKQDAHDEDILGVSVSCYWAEYDSESVVAGEHVRKVPAYDELLEYAPLNVSFATIEKGLVSISDFIQL